MVLQNPTLAEVLALKRNTKNEFLRALEDKGVVYVWPDYLGDHTQMAERLDLSSKTLHRGRFYSEDEIRESRLFR